MTKEYRKAIKFVYDLFNRNMDIFDRLDDDYEFWENSDIKMQGYGFKFHGKKDKFRPIIDVHLFHTSVNNFSISLFINNRNGNDIVMGNTIAIYSMDFKYEDGMNHEELDDRYRKMINSALDKWGNYCKENMLGYVEDEEEREEF